MNQTNENTILTVMLGLLLLFAIPAHAHRGDWYRTNGGTGNRLDFYSPTLFGWDHMDDAYLYDSNNESSPLHVQVNNYDNTLTHVTFGTDSTAGDRSIFPRYAYYPNYYASSEQWQILGSDGDPSYRSAFMTFAEFQNQVRSLITYYQGRLSSNPVYYQRLIDDANQAIGTATAPSVLSTWWNDFNTAVPSDPPPAGPTAVGTSTTGTAPTPTPSERDVTGLSAWTVVGAIILLATF